MSKEANWIDALVEKKYAIIPHYLTADETKLLRSELEALYLNHELHAARVGRGESAIRDVSRRGDLIIWFDPHHLLPAQSTLWQKLGEIKTEVNQALFLGLWACEGHYSVYPNGTFYEKHVDRFKGDQTSNLRTLSVVLYLNENWQPGDGGELVLYPDCVTVEPRGGTLVLFLSDAIPHEVKRVEKTRLSFAGWFTTRSVSDL